jgi:hypothetical protein
MVEMRISVVAAGVVLQIASLPYWNPAWLYRHDYCVSLPSHYRPTTVWLLSGYRLTTVSLLFTTVWLPSDYRLTAVHDRLTTVSLQFTTASLVLT